jgi:hypothetical protein
VKRLREIKVVFSSEERKYTLFIVKRLFKTDFYLADMVRGSKYSNPIPVKISASTRKEEIEHWLFMLKRYFTKKRHKKSGQSSCSGTG